MPARRSGVTFAGLTRISLNVVVYNEEARLEECLTDARPFVDEIVVVDQMSTDATPEIAQRLADVYVRDIHHGHAEPSRELAASRSSGDWLVILDADETMSDVFSSRSSDMLSHGASVFGRSVSRREVKVTRILNASARRWSGI